MKRQLPADVEHGAVQAEAEDRPKSAVFAWLRLARVFQKISQAEAARLRCAGLSVGQFDLLVQIASREGSTQQEIADSLLVTKSNVCQLLDRMERAGLVRRQATGRTNLLYLTAKGRELYDRVVPVQERLIAEQFSALSPTEQVQLLGLLRKVDRVLG